MKFFLLILALFGFSLSKETLIATTYPIYHPLKHLAGDLYEVSVLISAKTDVHHHELKPKDVKTLKKAKAVFTLGVEDWERRLPVDKGKLYTLNRGIDLIKDDPHLWMSPRSYKKLVDNLFKTLVQIDPKNEEIYRKRYEEYSRRLEELDKKYSKVLSECESRWVIATHLSLNYLARDYSLRAEGFRDLHAEEEPKPSEVGRIARLIKKESIKAIFMEEGYDEGVAKKISRETGTKVLRINTSLYPYSERDDYFSIMERNLQSLAEGLNCKR